MSREQQAMPLRAGDVYVTAREDQDVARHRRIIGVLWGGVVYSSGGDVNGLCKVESFRRWIQRQRAVRVDQNLRAIK